MIAQPSDASVVRMREHRPRLVTLQDAAIDSGIPANTLRDLTHRGHLTVVRLPGCRRWFFERADLARLIDQSKVVRTD